MARVKITLTCTECGKKFEHIHFCRNSSDTESYQKWAMENITICPSCHYAYKLAEEHAELSHYLEGYNLPEITGVSDKQITFANKLRTRFVIDLSRQKIDLRRFFQLSDALHLNKARPADRAKINRLAQQSGQTAEEWFAGYRPGRIAYLMGKIDKSIVGKIETVFSENEAAKIIDALK